MEGICLDIEGQDKNSRLTGRLRIPGQLIVAARNSLGNPQEWAGVVLVFLTLAVAVWSIEQAKWIKPQPSLIMVLALSVLVGWWLARSRLSAWVVYPLVVVLGLGVTVWQSIGNATPSGTESLLLAWWRTVTTGLLNEGTVFFAMFLVVVTWVMGYISTWFFVRRYNAWVAVAAGMLAILVNLSNLPREDHYLLVIYVLVALLLLGQASMVKQGAWFRREGISFSRPGVIRMVGAVVAISVLTVTVAWVVPEPPVDRIGMNLDTFYGENAQRQWFNIFADVSSKWSDFNSDEQTSLSFSDPLSTSSRPRFIVSADQPAYWRVMRYDTYHSWGWTSSEVVESEAVFFEADGVGELADGELVTYTVENKLRTDVLLVRGDFVSASIPALVQAFSPGEEGEGLLGYEDETELEDDFIAVVSPRTMRPYQRYTVMARVTTPTPEELSEAGTDYPEAITARYLQLPATLPERVVRLSRQVTAGAENAYDKTMAVLEYLNGFKYNLKAEVPPKWADGVDHFLFETKEGVCTDFASAVAVMMRSVGVPARINSGYLEGVPDTDTGGYVLRVKDYHSQPEIYFPGYGWVDFSATPVGDNTDDFIAAGEGGGDAPIDLEYWIEEEYYGGGEYVGEGPSQRRGLQGPAVYVYFVIIGIPLALFLVARFGYAYWLVRLKRVDNPADVYARMCYLASLSKSGPRPEETPLEYADRLVALVPLRSQAISLITQTYVETQFGPRRELSRLQTGRMQKAWVQLCPTLLKRLFSLRKRPE